MYDITNRESFENVEYWINEVRDQQVATGCSGDTTGLFYVIGNKCDLDKEREVAYEDGRRWVNHFLDIYGEDIRVDHLEISATCGTNIKAFLEDASVGIRLHADGGRKGEFQIPKKYFKTVVEPQFRAETKKKLKKY